MAENPIGEQINEPVRYKSQWWRVLVTGALLYILALGALILSANPNLFPTVVMVGSFLVPVTYVAFFYERRHLSRLAMPTTALAFIYGGVIGAIAASLIEPPLMALLGVPAGLAAGIVEELVKIIGVVLVARHRRHDSELDGILLGAAAGMGFAALESIGYAFTVFFGSRGSLTAVVGVTLVRGILSPLGHGTWTAILASTLFRQSKACRFRIDARVVGAYLTVVGLHALWDLVPGPLSAVLSTSLAILAAQIVIGAIGLFILARRWSESIRRQSELDPAEECDDLV